MASQRTSYEPLARQIAHERGIDPDVFVRLVDAESAWRPEAVSSAGAIGLAQLMPATARELGVNPWDPTENLRGGAEYLRRQLQAFGTYELALAAYNAGPGHVRQYGGVPPFPETRGYIARILDHGPAPAIAVDYGHAVAVGDAPLDKRTATAIVAVGLVAGGLLLLGVL